MKIKPSIASALLTLFAATALAQSEPNEEARRFLVYPPNKIISFSGEPDGMWYLHYYGVQLKKGNGYYNQVVQVSRFATEKAAVEACESTRAVPIPGKTVRPIEGFACAFVQEHEQGSGPNATRYRSSWYAKGNYFASLGESAEPRGMLPGTPPVGPLLAALGVGPALPRGEVVFRETLLKGLGLKSDVAKSCLDEVMTTIEDEARKDSVIAGQIDRLRKAAGAVRGIEILAAVPLDGSNFDDFDPKWWDALKEVVPNPWAPADPEDTATDWAQDLLPWPLNVLVDVARKGAKTMRTTKTHIVNPTMHRELYACYKRQRKGDGNSRIHAGMGQDALENATAQTLSDAMGASCPYVNDFENSYERNLRGLKGEARVLEFQRLIRPVGMRFEMIFRVEDAKENQQRLIADAWAPVKDLLAKLNVRVTACMSDRK